MSIINLKEIQSKLLQWEAPENPLAPLTASQKEAIFEMEALTNNTSVAEIKTDSPIKESDAIPILNTTYDFLEWYSDLAKARLKEDDASFELFLNQLRNKKDECGSMIDQVNATLLDLDKLSEEYNFVAEKTSTLHSMSEQLLADQNKLTAIGSEIKEKLHYFNQVEHLSQRLHSPTISINSEAFFNVVAKIDECLDYMTANADFKECHIYSVKYRHLQSRAISLLRSYACQTLNNATEQVLRPDEDIDDNESKDMVYAVYFGKFQAAAPKLRYVISEIEKRAERIAEYASLLSELQHEYTACRGRVADNIGADANPLPSGNAAGVARDHCALLRSRFSILAHACRDECALYSHFFDKTSAALEEYLQSMCNKVYETLRPDIIHINHLETLAELCLILKVEVLEEQVANDPARLKAVGVSARTLLQDAQERLAFRAHVHLRADVLRYRPAPGDLAYPDKLEMMEQIALSLQEQSLRRSESRTSIVSDLSTTSQEVASITLEAQRRPSSASPADLHGMWYPTVRRTLAALSRLYQCLEKKVFQGLAQEAISICVQSVDSASKQISTSKTAVDGELFQIKHLLILREQIAPFQVDFIIKETSLDFSNVRNAAYGLLQKPRHIFSFNSNNALLEFLLDGTPTVREHLLDSRKEVDRQLKSSCEAFIEHATGLLCGPLIAFLSKAQAFTPSDQLKSEQWAAPEQIAEAVKETQKAIKSHLAPLQRSMQLYLANKETEFILFRPIRNNVVGNFIQLEQLLTSAGYSSEDMLIVACPTSDQMAVFLSSASLIGHTEPVLPYSKKKTSTVVRKPSVTRIEENKEIVTEQHSTEDELSRK